MNKKAIAILGAIFILIVGTLGFLIYNQNKSKDPEPPTNQEPPPVVEETPPPVVEETPPPAPSGAIRLTDEPIISPILFFQGTGISYFDSSGQLYQTDLEVKDDGTALLSNRKQYSVALKPNITKILWPQVGINYIAQFGSDSKPTWSVYETSKAAYADVPPQVYSIDWMPSGDKIMYVWVDENGKATLNVSNPDTTGYQELTDFYEPDNVIDLSPDGANVLFYRTQTTDITKNTINVVTADGKIFKSIVKEGYNTGTLWSPDSKKFLFNKRDSASQKLALWVADISTGEVRNLNVFTTVDKAVWSKDGLSVFAGVPTTGIAGQGLTQDVLTKIIVNSGQQQPYESEIAIDARDLFLSSNESVLFFRNAQDNALYYIPVTSAVSTDTSTIQ